MSIKAQGPGIHTFVIVRDSIALNDSTVTHFMPDTLVNTTWVRGLIDNKDSVLWADHAGIADSLETDTMYVVFLKAQNIESDTINVMLIIPDTIKNDYINIKSTTANIISSGTDNEYAQFYSIKYGEVYQANVQVTDGTADVSAGAGINAGVPAYTITCDDGDEQSAVSMTKSYILMGVESTPEIQIKEDTAAFYGFIYMEDTKGDSTTIVRFDTMGLRYNADYYYGDITNPMWIPPKAYIDNSQLFKNIIIDINSSNLLNADSIPVLPATGTNTFYDIHQVTIFYNYDDANAYTGSDHSELKTIDEDDKQTVIVDVDPGMFTVSHDRIRSTTNTNNGIILFDQFNYGLNQSIWFQCGDYDGSATGTVKLIVYYSTINFN